MREKGGERWVAPSLALGQRPIGFSLGMQRAHRPPKLQPDGSGAAGGSRSGETAGRQRAASSDEGGAGRPGPPPPRRVFFFACIKPAATQTPYSPSRPRPGRPHTVGAGEPTVRRPGAGAGLMGRGTAWGINKNRTRGERKVREKRNGRCRVTTLLQLHFSVTPRISQPPYITHALAHTRTMAQDPDAVAKARDLKRKMRWRERDSLVHALRLALSATHPPHTSDPRPLSTTTTTCLTPTGPPWRRCTRYVKKRERVREREERERALRRGMAPTRRARIAKTHAPLTSLTAHPFSPAERVYPDL